MSTLNVGDFPIDENTVDGTELARRLERLYGAIYTSHSNGTRPADVQAGGIWCQLSGTGGVDKTWYAFDGTTDHELASIINGVYKGGGGGSIEVGDTAPAGATEGMLWVDTSTPSLNTYVYLDDGTSKQWVLQSNPNAIAERLNPNLLINGDMAIWQRGTTPFSGRNFTADRWKLGGATQTANRSRVDFNDIHTCIKGTSTSASWNIEQPIELPRAGYNQPLGKGDTFTLSFRARMSKTKADLTYGLNFRDTSGSGTNQVVVVGWGTVVKTPTTNGWDTYTFTFTVNQSPASTNKCASLLVGFANGDSTTNTEIEITSVKLERGSIATPFFADAPATNLALCQRYYQKRGLTYLHPYGTNSFYASKAIKTIFLSPPMRVPPTIILGNPTNLTAQTSVIVDNATFYVTGNPSTANQASRIGNWTAEAEL